jgi:hypothetical protein
MANVKNFSLIGVGNNVQWAKGGSRIKTTGSVFNLRNLDDSGDVALTTEGITSSAGNVTLTTGNVVLSSNSGVVTLGDAGSLGRAGTGVYSLSGTGAIVVPSGTTAQEPAFATYPGAFRYNTDTTTMEFSDGTAWQQLSFAAGTVTSIVGTANQITASSPSGAVTLSIPSSFIAPGSVSSTSSIVAGTTLTISGNTANAFLYSGAAGLVSSTAAATNGQLLIGSTGAAPVKASLTAGSGITITPGAGSITIAADPTAVVTTFSAGTTGFTPSTATSGAITLAGILSLANGGTNSATSGSNGSIMYNNGTAIVNSSVGSLGQVLTSAGAGAPTWTTASSTVTTNQIVQGNGSGAFTANGATFVGSGSYSGVTLSGTVTNATDATTKAYVDSLTSGLSWKQAVRVATTTSGILASSFENGDTIDGITLATGNRILIKNQIDGEIDAVGTITGTGYTASLTNDGPYALQTSGAGVGATATFSTDGSGNVTAVTIVTRGSGYAVSDTISSTAFDTARGGSGAGATITVVSNSAENGIYTVNASGAPTRSIDMNSGPEFDGSAVFVQEGTVNNSTAWTETATVVTVDTDPVIFTQFAGNGTYLAGSGLTLTGNTFSANTTGVTTFITGNNIAVKSSATSNQVLLSQGSGNEAAWGSLPLGNSSAVSGTLAATNGGTGFASYAVGDLLYANTTTSLAKLADVATGNALISGGVGVAPSWGKISLTTAVSGVLPTANGGTNLSSFVANEVFYPSSTSVIAQSANFTFDGTSTLTVGGSLPLAIDGALGSITATTTNSDIVLLPNGTGSVIIGPVGAGLIQSDGATALTVRGNTTLTLESGTGDTIMVLSGTTNAVTVSGPTAAQYSANLADADLANKYYVDAAIASGAASGAIKSYVAIVPLDSNTGGSPISIGSALPAGATIVQVKVNVTVADTGAVLTIGKTGSTSAYMTATENDPQTVGLYIAEDYVVEAGSVQVIATVTSSAATSGATCTVMFEYKVA